MASVRLEQVGKHYGKTQVIHDVSLDVADQEFCVFVGPSGSGKSTLLRMIAGLEDISEGKVIIGDQLVNDMPPARREIAMVFQSYALYPHMSVYDNLAFALKLAGKPRAEIDQRVRRAAEILQITPLLNRRPKDMSGGQRQRVAIGRAIVRNPQVFLFDEPLSNLDAKLRVNMRKELSQLHRDLNATMIYVTHDQVEAMTLADRILVLRAGEVAQVGTPMTLYHRPENLFVAGFIGAPSMNFMPASLSPEGRVKSGSIELQLPLSGTPGSGQVTLGIRPEHAVLGDTSLPHLMGTVTLAENLGETAYVYLQVAEQELVVKDNEGRGFRRGDSVPIGIPAEQTHLFNADEQAIRAWS